MIKEKRQITSIKNENGDITTESTDIQRIIKEHCYLHKFDNLSGQIPKTNYQILFMQK